VRSFKSAVLFAAVFAGLIFLALRYPRSTPAERQVSAMVSVARARR